ncbi:MAG: fructose-1,6-bisphosphatase [Bacteroidales bacterium]|nr:fructose-1,6-bisphosphatase [Bacteroidales bacterium]
MTIQEVKDDQRYLKLLAEKFPTIADAATEIINLEAIMNLPKGTEHFLSDLHGENNAFQHVLKNASGVIRRKVDDIFGMNLRESDKNELCSLIYYPEDKLRLIAETESNLDDWYRITLHRVVEVARVVSSKYTRSKVRKLLPKDFSYIIEELLHEQQSEPNKQEYYAGIINSIINTNRSTEFIIAICQLIHRLVIDSLHIVGDVYDRGPGACSIMDTLCGYHDFDIQWGNHDISWMGAAAGNLALIANVVRISIRYMNVETLEEGYSINLLPLATFAIDFYGKDPCREFQVKEYEADSRMAHSTTMMAKMHKAISIIQFKLEGQIVKRHPEYNMDDRNLMHLIDYKAGTITIGGKTYPLIDKLFPTVDPQDPYKLTPEEQRLMDQLHHSFTCSERLQKHLRCLYRHGSLFLTRNNNLLYHASVPLNADGTFKKVVIEGVEYSGKKLMEKIDSVVRDAYFEKSNISAKNYALDYMWYLWCGPDSPLYNKDKMTTFERYFIDDQELYKEQKGAYYELCNQEETCNTILKEFGLDPNNSRIINGHIPVRTTNGESPLRANGKRLVIDGGFSKAYHSTTGIAGYTLIYNSHGLQLVQHEAFESKEKAVLDGTDIHSRMQLVEFKTHRMLVRDTDRGRELAEQIGNLQRLLVAYRNGLIKEN